jgi:hypothetical protein
LHARDEFEDGGYAPLHLVHCCSLRVHVSRFAWASCVAVDVAVDAISHSW